MHAYMYTYVCMYVCVYIYIYIYVYTHLCCLTGTTAMKTAVIACALGVRKRRNGVSTNGVSAR